MKVEAPVTHNDVCFLAVEVFEGVLRRGQAFIDELEAQDLSGLTDGERLKDFMLKIAEIAKTSIEKKREKDEKGSSESPQNATTL